MRQHAAADEAGDGELVARLRAGDERAFAKLVEANQAAMVRVAELFVPRRSVAEEVVQEAWVGVLQGLESFEGRSSLKTWMFRILTNRAKTRGERERRTLPMSALERPELEGGGAAVAEDRFHPPRTRLEATSGHSRRDRPTSRRSPARATTGSWPRSRSCRLRSGR